ncbi:Uncharacterised protein [Staphylococcus gallinarum]|uniref:Uncharacterized protein n=1 Tax=Staphylococcus gallinarum TaxID=1293 RepID=A0A380FEL9_STAGA|nr:Uncharacterised protein [Staphylococcus gallinarum]
MLEFEQGFNHLATLKVIGVGGRRKQRCKPND